MIIFLKLGIYRGVLSLYFVYSSLNCSSNAFSSVKVYVWNPRANLYKPNAPIRSEGNGRAPDITSGVKQVDPNSSAEAAFFLFITTP